MEREDSRRPRATTREFRRRPPSARPSLSGSFRFPWQSGVKMGFGYLAIILGYSLYFAWRKGFDYALILPAAPAGLLLGLVLLFLERGLDLLKAGLRETVGLLLTSFWLFFAHLIGYLFCGSLLVSYPIGTYLKSSPATQNLAQEYGLFSTNLLLILGVVSWAVNMRSDSSGAGLPGSAPGVK